MVGARHRVPGYRTVARVQIQYTSIISKQHYRRLQGFQYLYYSDQYIMMVEITHEIDGYKIFVESF